MPLSNEELTQFGDILISLLPKDGSPQGNLRTVRMLAPKLRSEFSHDMTDDEYWEIRNPLIQKGLISKSRARGGAIRLVLKNSQTKPSKNNEQALYKPFIEYVKRFWVKDNSIKEFIVQNTANQGSRKTGGKWTRPDVTVISIKTYTFTQGRHLELITFEIKPEGIHDISGVFETASHSVYAHKSYLAIACPDGKPESEDFERIELLSKKFGIGLIIFSDPDDIESYEELIEPERKNPDPSDVDEFILTQVSSENQNTIHKMLK